MDRSILQVNLDLRVPEKDPRNYFYIFDDKVGILQISTNPSNLEKLLVGVELPQEGASIELSRPPLQKEPVIFSGVKRVESIPDLKDEEYLWIPDYIKVK